VRRHAKASFAGSTLGSGIRRGRLGLVCLCVLGLAAFLGSSAPSAGAQACPNEEFRQGPSANLPDCRAYEQVTPLDMEGQEVNISTATISPAPTVSPDGNTVAWGSLAAFGEAESNGLSTVYLSRRGASWTSKNVSPPLGTYGHIITSVTQGFTDDMEGLVIESGLEPPLTPDASTHSPNLYLRDNGSDSFRLLSVGMPSNTLEIEVFSGEGLSAHAEHVAFTSFEALTPDSAGAKLPYLYDSSAATGMVSLIGRAPVTNEVLKGSKVELAGPNFRHPVSDDGSRIFFKGGGGGCGVCVRINGAATQIVSETGTFQQASNDGSVAYVIEGGDLKRYDVATEALTDLTPAGEVRGVLGTSADGSRVYFAAKGALAPGATPGENNVYLWTAGSGLRFIATGSTSEFFRNNWEDTAPGTYGGLVHRLASRVTPDGMHLAFQADNSLTGFPNNEKSEVYLYSAATDELVCASCTVAEPESGTYILGGSEFLIQRLPRNLSDDGARLFFLSFEALVPQDTNGLEDVYEYDAASGKVALISPGTDVIAPGNVGVEADYFGDATPDGSDVFFFSREPLVPVDEDEYVDVYDARVDGGLASQHPAPPAAPCTGDACRGESSSPDLAAPASAGFVGKGNLSSKQNCNKLGREAKKLSKRAKKLRKNAKTAKRNGKSAVAKKRNRKATRQAKRARNKSKSAKKCRKRNRRASK